MKFGGISRLKMKFCIPKPSLFSWLLFALSVAVVVIWFREGRIIYFWDATFPVNPSLALHNYASLWDYSTGVGTANFTGFKLVPYIAILYFFNSILDLPLYLAQALLYFILLFHSSYGMYIFAKSLANVFPKSYTHGKFSGLLGFSAALFYMANLYSILFLWRIFSTALFLYLALPYLFYFALRIARNGVNIRDVSGAVIVSLFSSVSDPALFAPAGIFLLAFVIMLMFREKFHSERINWRPLLVVTALITTNLYWALPLSIFSGYSTFPTSTLYGGTTSALEFNSKFADSLSVAMLRGQQILYETYQGQTDYSWVSSYYGNGTVGLYLISVLILAFVASAFFYLRKKWVSFFAAFALIFGFLVEGVHQPFGEVYLWLFQNVPLFTAYRDPYAHFGLFYLFCLAILFAVGVANVASEIQKRIQLAIFRKYLRMAFVLVILILVCGIYVWPFWTGAVIPSGTDIRPSASIEIPNYYYQISQYLLSHTNGSKVLLLPFQSSPLESSLWPHGYVGFPIIRSLTYVPVIFGIQGSEPGDSLDSAIIADLQQNLSSVFILLSNMGVKYIVVDETTNPNFDPTAMSYIRIEQFLNKSNSVTVVDRFGALLLYKMKVYEPLFSFSPYQEIQQFDSNSTNIDLSKLQPGYGPGQLTNTSAAVTMYCQVANASSYCNFDLTNLDYNTTVNPYFAIAFRSINNGRLTISFTDYEGGYWPTANSTYTTGNNVYSSNNSMLLVYDLFATMHSLNGIHLHVLASGDDMGKTTVGINVSLAYLVTAEPLSTPGGVSFRRSGTSSYSVLVQNASSPFDLIFDEAYDPSWIASSVYPNGTMVVYPHYLQNGFQNVWYVNRNGTFSLNLIYKPQELLYPSIISSIVLTFVLLSSVALFTSKRFRSRFASQPPKVDYVVDSNLSNSLGRTIEWIGESSK